MHVKQALAGVSGISEAQVEVGKATLSGDFNLDAVKAAVEKAGYEVVSVA
jgi:copper chaperone CopZ